MTFTVKTIPDMLVEAYGNQTEVARILNCNRATVRKYIGDKEGKDTLSSTVFFWFTADGVKILMRDIRQVLERWGAWAANNHEDVTWSPIAAGFKRLIPEK